MAKLAVKNAQSYPKKPYSERKICSFRNTCRKTDGMIEGGSDGRLKINGETHTEAVCLIEGRCLPANAARPQDLTADSFQTASQNTPRPKSS